MIVVCGSFTGVYLMCGRRASRAPPAPVYVVNAPAGPQRGFAPTVVQGTPVAVMATGAYNGPVGYMHEYPQGAPAGGPQKPPKPTKVPVAYSVETGNPMNL